MNATIHSWFARPALNQGAIHTIAIACFANDISELLAKGLNLRIACHQLALFCLTKLFLMSFSYIGNVVSAQLIHKETPPALIGLANIFERRMSLVVLWFVRYACFKQEKRQGEKTLPFLGIF